MTANVHVERPFGAHQGGRYNHCLGSEPNEQPARGGRLESWKEIASYLNRSERTVRRWEEKEGLPVRRLQHDKRGSVYAYAADLDAWRDSRQQLVASEPAAAPAATERSTSRRWVPASIAIVLVAVLGLLLTIAWRSDDKRPGTSNPEALRAFKQAEFAFNAGRIQVQSGIRYYNEAIRLDPAYPDAWAGLASAHVAQTWFSDLPAKETLASAKRAAERALQLDPSLSGPWRVLGAVSHFHEWNHASAERQFLKAIELEPTSGVAASWYAEFLMDMRRFDEASTYLRRAQDATPRWLEPMMVSGNLLTFAGHPAQAIAEYERALAIEPTFGLANHFLGRAYVATGAHQTAIAQLRKSDTLLGHVPFTLGDLGYALAVSGARAEAESISSEMLRRREQGFFPAYPVAAIQMGLGHTDAALEWLEHAADERHPGYYMPAVDPIYAPLRTHPRFKALMQRMDLPR
jgi:tetratricopeptide (TPR) repeat protein